MIRLSQALMSHKVCFAQGNQKQANEQEERVQISLSYNRSINLNSLCH